MQYDSINETEASDTELGLFSLNEPRVDEELDEGVHQLIAEVTEDIKDDDPQEAFPTTWRNTKAWAAKVGRKKSRPFSRPAGRRFA